MTDIRKGSYGRWLGIPTVVVLVLVLSACHFHLRRHHTVGDAGEHHHKQTYIVALG